MVSFLNWALIISYPLVNFLLAGLFLFYSRGLPYQTEFKILGISSFISGSIQALELLMRLQKSLGFVWITREVARQLWWIRAPLDLISMGFYVLAIFLLIQKMHRLHNSPRI
jgi:hypothetical protein